MYKLEEEEIESKFGKIYKCPRVSSLSLSTSHGIRFGRFTSIGKNVVSVRATINSAQVLRIVFNVHVPTHPTLI